MTTKGKDRQDEGSVEEKQLADWKNLHRAYKQQSLQNPKTFCKNLHPASCLQLSDSKKNPTSIPRPPLQMDLEQKRLRSEYTRTIVIRPSIHENLEKRTYKSMMTSQSHSHSKGLQPRSSDQKVSHKKEKRERDPSIRSPYNRSSSSSAYVKHSVTTCRSSYIYIYVCIGKGVNIYIYILVQTYHPTIVSTNKSVIKEWKLYSNINSAKDLFCNSPVCAYRQPPNLKHMLVKSNLSRIPILVGSSKCMKPRCQVCDIIDTRQKLQFPVTSSTIQPGNYNCDSCDIIYLLMCSKCDWKLHRRDIKQTTI